MVEERGREEEDEKAILLYAVYFCPVLCVTCCFQWSISDSFPTQFNSLQVHSVKVPL